MIVVWLTGLPAAGKTTLAQALAAAVPGTVVLDGDVMRATVSRDLGFDRGSRAQQAHRATAEALRRSTAGAALVVVALVSPFAADRAAARASVEAVGDRFLEVFVDTPASECRARDPRGLWARAAGGSLTGLTGWDAPYEKPRTPDVRVGPDDDGVAQVLAAIRSQA